MINGRPYHPQSQESIEAFITIYRMHLLVQRIIKNKEFDLDETVSDFLQYYNSKSIVNKTYFFRYNISIKQWEFNTGGNSE